MLSSHGARALISTQSGIENFYHQSFLIVVTSADFSANKIWELVPVI